MVCKLKSSQGFAVLIYLIFIVIFRFTSKTNITFSNNAFSGLHPNSLMFDTSKPNEEFTLRLGEPGDLGTWEFSPTFLNNSIDQNCYCDMFDLVDGQDPHDETEHDHSETSMNPLKNSLKCRNPKNQKWIGWKKFHSLEDCQSKHWSRSTSFIATISVCLFLSILLIITLCYFHLKRRKEKGSVVTINLGTIEEDT